MSTPLLYEYYLQLPPRPADGASGPASRRYQVALARFSQAVAKRYTEGTLLRLLHHPAGKVRSAAALALGVTATMRANRLLAKALYDEDPEVRTAAADALWALWFRADTPAHNEELQRLVRLGQQAGDPKAVLAGYAALLKQAPKFAEAYNQRAIYLFRRGDFLRAAADCEKVLRLNPVHFGAASGLGQCLMKLRKLPAALRAYRRAYRINPGLEGVEKIIKSLEKLLGGEGRK